MKPLPAAALCALLPAMACMAPEPATAPDGAGYMVQRTVAEVNALPDEFSARYGIRGVPRGNVVGVDVPELLVGSVIVGRWAPDSRGYFVAALTADGRFHECWVAPSESPRSTHVTGTWRTGGVGTDARGRVWPWLGMDYGRGPVPWIALYDAESGDFAKFMYRPDELWIVWTGHPQRRLPASVPGLCPEFPPAAALGLETNRAQTASSYDGLLAQHPGERVLRPDLVTPHGEIVDRVAEIRRGSGVRGGQGQGNPAAPARRISGQAVAEQPQTGATSVRRSMPERPPRLP